MEMGKGGAFYEPDSAVELSVPFSGKTDHHVGAERCSGNGTGHVFDQLHVKTGRVIPFHRLKDGIVAALEGNVKMTAQPVAQKFNNAPGDFPGFYGAEPYP